MIDFIAAFEANALAEHLRVSRWTYPLVNAGHVFAIALVVGTTFAMNLRVLQLIPGPAPEALVASLRPVAICGLVLAAATGAMLFAVQATDYAQSGWFRLKMVLLAAALANAAVHLRRPPGLAGAGVSLVLWPAVLVSGRMIGYS